MLNLAKEKIIYLEKANKKIPILEEKDEEFNEKLE